MVTAAHMELISIAALLILLPATFVKSHRHGYYDKVVVVTNNHTNYLSVRCFSFDDDFTVVHLSPWAQYKFGITIRKVFPSATMFNCSTNMGTFVAFKHDYECAKDDYDTCDWRFDEDNAYFWNPKANSWVTYDYDPNYESLTRGGVIQGYFAN